MVLRTIRWPKDGKDSEMAMYSVFAPERKETSKGHNYALNVTDKPVRGWKKFVALKTVTTNNGSNILKD